MPGPPPPPPPAGCPPPPMPAFAPPSGGGRSAKGGGDERSALLTAIRKQPKLNRVDKTLINDRSEPLATATGKSKPAGGSPTSGGSAAGAQGGGAGAMMNGPPNGLGGLFQGGMPKLKSVNRNNGSSNHTTNGPGPGSDSAPASMMNSTGSIGSTFGDIQQELKKRLNNDVRNTSRGPAPPAPSRNIANELSSLQSKNGYQINNKSSSQSQAQHRKTQSNGNFNTLDSPTTPQSRISNHATSTPAKNNYGKPHLAPKPPVLEKPNSATLPNGRLRKSNSVRLPSSPLSAASSSEHYDPNTSPGVFHFDTLKSRYRGGSTPHLAAFKPRPINGRPTQPPPSIPAQKVKPPTQAPPPPPSAPTTPLPAAPSHAPPPPPHRTVPPVPTRAAPAVPSAAPAPPPRNSSIRPSGASTFESRYVFRPMGDFPPPMQFRNVEKVYTTARQAGKQQAPQPPTAPPPPQQQQLQLAGGHRLWESSTC